MSESTQSRRSRWKTETKLLQEHTTTREVWRCYDEVQEAITDGSSETIDKKVTTQLSGYMDSSMVRPELRGRGGPRLRPVETDSVDQRGATAEVTSPVSQTHDNSLSIKTWAEHLLKDFAFLIGKGLQRETMEDLAETMKDPREQKCIVWRALCPRVLRLFLAVNKDYWMTKHVTFQECMIIIIEFTLGFVTYRFCGESQSIVAIVVIV